MSTLVWDNTKVRMYETGIEKGVFYPSDGPGVVWNGLLSVVENLSGGEQGSYAADGVTYLNSVGARNYQATVQAFSAPREFSPYVGDLEVIPGFILTRQPRKQFGFSYKSLIANIGYKIHLVYNATATPTSRSYASTNDSPVPMNLEWKIDAVPVATAGYRPSAHYIVDSTKIDPADLATLEDILYGTDTAEPALPTVDDLVNLLDPPIVSLAVIAT